MRLLVTDKIDGTGLLPLRREFQIVVKTGLSVGELNRIIGEYDCIITRSPTGVGKDLIKKAKRLKIIARAAIGVDNIDIFAATAKKIAVINAPKGNSKVTAEHTIGLVFSLLRHIPQASADLKKGIWGKTKYIGTQLYGKTLGIVGFGNVGREVYRMADGLGMKVVVCEPYIRLPKRVKKLTFEELLGESDIVTFHVPLTYLTRNMINKKTVYLLKKGAYLINCSRGGVIDDKAVYKALKSGHLAGFAVDVFVKEPEVDQKLLALPNVIATPHIAGSTMESQKQSITEVASGILKYLKGEVPNNLLNPQVFRKKTGRKRKIFGFDAIVFDCDSTLSAIEGIDELADMIGKKEEVSRLTDGAMEGRLRFETVFDRRLEIVQPSRNSVMKVGQKYIETLVDDAKEVIEALKLLGKEIYIVSSGYSQALYHLGEWLGIPKENIFGIDLVFDKNGNYQGFIEGPLRRNHGKLQIIRQIPGRKLVVGDSITDLETRECVDLFVGFGGVVKRNKVEKGSDIYLRGRSLAPILVIAGGMEGCVRLLSTKYKKYIGKGIDLLFHEVHVKMEKEVKKHFAQFKELAYY